MYKNNNLIQSRFEPIFEITKIINLQINYLVNRDQNIINKNQDLKEKISIKKR